MARIIMGFITMVITMPITLIIGELWGLLIIPCGPMPSGRIPSIPLGLTPGGPIIRRPLKRLG